MSGLQLLLTVLDILLLAIILNLANFFLTIHFRSNLLHRSASLPSELYSSSTETKASQSSERSAGGAAICVHRSTRSSRSSQAENEVIIVFISY